MSRGELMWLRPHHFLMTSRAPGHANHANPVDATLRQAGLLGFPLGNEARSEKRLGRGCPVQTELQGLDGVGCQRPTRRSFCSWQSLFLGSAGCLAAFELPPALDVQ